MLVNHHSDPLVPKEMEIVWVCLEKQWTPWVFFQWIDITQFVSTHPGGVAAKELHGPYNMQAGL